jgi:hypothetical protein
MRFNVRTCRIADVAQAHTHALLGILDRGSMAAMIAEFDCVISLLAEPNADYLSAAAM